MDDAGIGGDERRPALQSPLAAQPDPWTVRWSSSVSASDESAEAGAWIIWLPPGSLVGASVDTDTRSEGYMRPLRKAADGYPEGWYVFPESVEIDDDGTTSVYASMSGSKIRLSSGSAGLASIHVADIVCDSETGAKNVRQVARSICSVSDTPWTFTCTVNPTTGERVGGWTNGRLQVGYDCGWGTPDVARGDDHKIADCDSCADGYHAIEIDTNAMTAKIIVDSDSVPSSDYAHGIVPIYIGYVANGALVLATHMNPTCYILL